MLNLGEPLYMYYTPSCNIGPRRVRRLIYASSALDEVPSTVSVDPNSLFQNVEVF